MFKFRCMHCDRKIAVPAEHAGRQVRCPGCRQPVMVPYPSPGELAAVDAHDQAPSAKSCPACGAAMMASAGGVCAACGFDPSASLKAAYDASRATVASVAAPPKPDAMSAASPHAVASADRALPGRTRILFAALTVLLVAAAWVAYIIWRS